MARKESNMKLNEGEKWILKILFKQRCFTPSSGYNSNKLWRLFNKKFKPRRRKTFDEGIQHLLNHGYIGQVRKKDIKYYIDEKKVKELYLTGSLE